MYATIVRSIVERHSYVMHLVSNIKVIIRYDCHPINLIGHPLYKQIAIEREWYKSLHGQAQLKVLAEVAESKLNE